MAENDSQHLTEGQIFVLAETGGDQAVLCHIESCTYCRNLLNDWRLARSLVAPAGSSPSPGEPCPSADELANYAAGALPADRSDAILVHLVDCADCSAILADSVAADPAPRRAPIPIRSSVEPRGRRSAPYWKYGIAAALLLALGASFVLWRIEQRSKQPAALLAEVYTQVRPFDYRLPDAGYGPIRLQRGAQSDFAAPEALPSAVAAIRRMLDAHPQSAAALALKGRAELLQNNFESAIESLTRATAKAPHDMDALADLAAAYAVRGEFENRRDDYGQAMDLLLRALRQRPDDPRILFNLALTYQKLSMVDEAIGTWRRFLQGKPPAGWRREAEEQLAHEETMKAGKPTGEIFTDPKRFLVAYGSGEPFDPLPWYDIFWTDWLPRVSSDPAAARAARLLATAFTRYGEFSLTDTLNAPAAAVPRSAIALLARTIVLNRSGHPGEALATARDAAAQLDSAGLHAAAGLARAEFVYAARWVDAYRECRQTTGLLLASLGARYPWIAVTAMLNYSSCLLREGEDGRARAEIEGAQARLAGSPLWPLTLRAAQFTAGADSEIGNFGPVWETAPDGLRRYWTTAASDYRAEGFYDFLRIAAVGMGWRECAVVFYRGAIRFAHAASNPEMEAANRSELAKLLQQMGDYPGEMRELAEMNRLLDSLGQRHDAAILRWEAALLRIQADLATGVARDPLPELGRLAADAAGAGAIQRGSLAQTEGLAYQARGDSSHAAAAFARAIGLAEQRAASLNSWMLRIPVIESAGPSYRNLTLIQLMRQHDPASAFATWSRFRPGAEGARRCIAIAPLPEGIAIWTVIDGAVSVRWVDGNTDDLERSAEEFLSLCASPASGEADIHRVGNRLYAALLRPELQRLGPGTILLLAKSWVEKIPFGALTGDHGEYLARRYHFVQAYGPPRSTPAGAITSGAAALIVAAPAGIAPGQPPLPVLTAADREAADVAAHFPSADVSRDATLDWLSENAPKAEVFHFCGHGWANGGNGALILPPGPNREPRFVTAANLAAQNWSRCRLAVLSACLTAAGETRGAVNNQSLVQALLSAGSRRVVAARWSVDSEATRVLMDAFYARLALGKSVPEALYGAEAEVAESPGWSRPYYWAGFDLFGSA